MLFPRELKPAPSRCVLPDDEDALRALIDLAHRRDDRSPAVRNFVTTARAMRPANQGSGSGIAKVPKKITCSDFDHRGLPPRTSTVLPPCRLRVPELT